MVVEAVFWFYPLVWWMERRMVEERERACDEAVVEMGSRPGIYAESLLKACRFCVESPLVCVSGITGADLAMRVRKIMTPRMERMSMGKKVALALFGIIVIVTPILLGQSEAAQRVMLAAADAAPMPFRAAARGMIAEVQTTSTALIAELQMYTAVPRLIAQATNTPSAASTAAPAAFEIADVHDSPYRRHPAIRFSVHGDRLLIRDATLVDLIADTYAVDPSSVFGEPQWLAFDHFDIFAKLPPATTRASVMPMLRPLLDDRFKLVAQTSTRPLPAFVLSAGSSPKLKKSADSAGPGGCQYQQPPKEAQLTNTMNIKFSCRNTTLQSFVGFLHEVASPYLTRPVVDATGLKDGYDFDIEWTYQIPKDADGVTIFQAIDKQLGLKLALKTTLLPVVDIVSVNQQPTPNVADIDKLLPPPPPAEFDVAVIRPGNPNETRFGMNIQGNTVNIQYATLLTLIYNSFNTPRER